MCGPKQLFLSQCGPQMPKAWSPPWANQPRSGKWPPGIYSDCLWNLLFFLELFFFSSLCISNSLIALNVWFLLFIWLFFSGNIGLLWTMHYTQSRNSPSLFLLLQIVSLHGILSSIVYVAVSGFMDMLFISGFALLQSCN